MIPTLSVRPPDSHEMPRSWNLSYLNRASLHSHLHSDLRYIMTSDFPYTLSCYRGDPSLMTRTCSTTGNIVSFNPLGDCDGSGFYGVVSQ